MIKAITLSVWFPAFLLFQLIIVQCCAKIYREGSVDYYELHQIAFDNAYLRVLKRFCFVLCRQSKNKKSWEEDINPWIMYKLLGGLKDYFKLQEIQTDNAVFRLHNVFTTVLLLTCSLVITATQYVGNPISCIVNGVPTHVVNTFCWISSTFTMPDAYRRQVRRHERGQAMFVSKAQKIQFHSCDVLSRLDFNSTNFRSLIEWLPTAYTFGECGMCNWVRCNYCGELNMNLVWNK